MREESERLLRLLRGSREDRAPLWEPWFQMHVMLRDHYGGSQLRMADHLRHAALPLGRVDTGVGFYKPVRRIEKTGVWYGGGLLRRPKQLRDRPEPDYGAQAGALLARRTELQRAGIACWMVLPWCFHAVATGMGWESFALACYDRPEFIHEAMQWAEARNRRAIEQVVAKVKPDFLLYDGDCAHKTGAMINPDMLRRFCLAPTEPGIQMLRDMGVPPVFHSDGRLTDVIPLLCELGFAAVHGCEKQANDLQRLVETFGNQIVLCGNMDVVFLKDATPRQVRRETLEMLHTGGGKGKFVAGCNTSPLDYIPYENYQTFCLTVAEYTPKGRALGGRRKPRSRSRGEAVGPLPPVAQRSPQGVTIKSCGREEEGGAA